jgi:hypothetical protein
MLLFSKLKQKQPKTSDYVTIIFCLYSHTMNFGWKTYLTLGGIYLGYRLYKLYQLGENVTYTPIGVSFVRGKTIVDSVLRVRMRLDNPTNASVNMKGVDGTISVGSDVVGAFASKPFIIKQGENFFDLDFKILPNSAGTIFLQSVINKKAPVFSVTLNKRTQFITTSETFDLNA